MDCTGDESRGRGADRVDRARVAAGLRAGEQLQHIEDSSEKLEEIQAWAVDRLLRFKRVFGPRLRDLVA